MANEINTMKIRFNLTIEDNLLFEINRYAAKRKISVSELVEEYFNTLLTKPSASKNIIDLIEKLPYHSLPVGQDLKKAFYEDQAG